MSEEQSVPQEIYTGFIDPSYDIDPDSIFVTIDQAQKAISQTKGENSWLAAIKIFSERTGQGLPAAARTLSVYWIQVRNQCSGFYTFCSEAKKVAVATTLALRYYFQYGVAPVGVSHPTIQESRPQIQSAMDLYD